jgi:DNA repair protein RadC
METNKDNNSTIYHTTNIKTNGELVNFMSTNCIYPFFSKKGKVFLRCARKNLLTTEKKVEIIQQLNIKTKEDCDRLRNEIKSLSKEHRTNLPIRKWIKEERPREMLAKIGAENLPLAKLLAIILRTGKEGKSAEDLARELLNCFGSLRAIDSATISDISKIEGIGFSKAVQVKAAIEIGKRFLREQAQARKKLNKPDDVISYVCEYYSPYLRDSEKEFFNVLLLDVKNKVIDNVELSKGSISATIVDPREIVKLASLKAASSIILVHNHPSGETNPSKEDIELTNRIKEACNLLDIKVLDHIIIGKNSNDYYSFAKEGLIRE